MSLLDLDNNKGALGHAMALPTNGMQASLSLIEASSVYTAAFKELKKVWVKTPGSAKTTAQDLADSIADLRDQILELADALPAQQDFTLSGLAESIAERTTPEQLHSLAQKLDSILLAKDGKPVIGSTLPVVARPILETHMRRTLSEEDMELLEGLGAAIFNEGVRGIRRGWTEST